MTTIRTVGGVADFDTIIRDAARRGEILSPPGGGVQYGGHRYPAFMAGSAATGPTCAGEGGHGLRGEDRGEKPDLVKLMITGGVMDAEVVERARRHCGCSRWSRPACGRPCALGMQVAAHVEPERPGICRKAAWTPSSTAQSRMRYISNCVRNGAFRCPPSCLPYPMRCSTQYLSRHL